MSHIAYFNIPFLGHINPSLALVQELVRLGETVDYYCFEEVRPQIEFTGAQFQRLPTRHIDSMTKPQAPSGPVLTSHLMEISLEVMPVLLERFRRDPPAMIILGHLCPWGSFIGRVLNIPTVVTYSSFAQLPNLLPPLPLFLMAQNIRWFPKNLPFFFKYWQLSRQLARQYDIERPKMKDLFGILGDLNIIFTSEMFQPNRENCGCSYVFTGASLTDRIPDSEFSSTEIQWKSLIYISLGTLFNQNVPFFKNCLLAFQGTEHTVVMLVDNSTNIQALGEIPPNFIIRSQVPQLEILKYARVFITHGGMNSTSESLVNRVPLVVYPQGADQYVIAKRIQELGVGVWLTPKNLQPMPLRTLVERVMTDAGIQRNVERVGNSLREAGGAPKAAKVILEFKNATRS